MKSNIKLPKYIGHDFTDKKIMSKDDIRNRFDNEVAELYSQRKPLWLPEFEFAFQSLTDSLEPFIKKNTKMLDIGAGTGNLTRSIFEKYKHIHSTLYDFSENMLSYAPTVLKGFEGQYHTIVGDIFKLNFKPSSFDIVVSSFAIHHARGYKQYLKLYQSIYNCLKRGGVFVCCDVINGATEAFTKQNELGWADFLRKQNFNDKEVKKVLDNYHHEDTPISVSKHFELLQEAQFKKTDIIWKKYNFGIYIGIK